MKREFVKIIYAQWDNQNEKENKGFGEDINAQMHEITATIQSFKGKRMAAPILLALDDAVNDAQFKIHEHGFTAGFEMACSILREMMGGADRV